MKVNGTILLGDGRRTIKKIRKESVHCVVTSPPYWGLRKYGDEENPGDELGMERTPEEFVENLVSYFKLIKPVLRKDGVVFLNIGDCYMSTNHDKHTIIKPNDLVAIPWMTALAMRADGWYLRSPVIWEKATSMPSSVKDRPGLNHEYIFLMAKAKGYYYDPYAVKSPTGNMLRSVWKMGNKKEKNVQHFATFPVDLPYRCIQIGTSEGCCSKCGTPYIRKMRENKPEVKVDRKKLLEEKDRKGILGGGDDSGLKKPPIYKETIGWEQNCKCKAVKKVPCTVLDPFFGSGTTGVAAEKLKRKWLGLELYKKNKEIAMNRIKASIVGADYMKPEKRKAFKKKGFGLSRRA